MRSDLRRPFMLFSGLSLALALLITSAHAATVQRTVTFDPSSAGTFFTANLLATGTLSIQASASVTLSTGPVLGTPISVTAPINIPLQNFNINENLNLSADPTGTMTLELPDTNETFGGAFPNLFGALTEADIPDLDVTLVGPAGIQVLNFPGNVTGSATLDILSITSINIPLQANLNVLGELKNVIYNQIGNAFIGPGVVTNPNGQGPPGSITTAYEIPGPATGGVLSGGDASIGVAADVTGSVSADLGIFGSLNQDLGTINVIDDTVPVDLFALLFDMFLTDLEPNAFGEPRDINVDLDGNFDLAGPLEFDFDLPSQVLPLAFDFDVPIADLGIFGSVTLDGTLTGNLTASLDTNLTIQNIQYGLEDEVLADALVPEPSSLMLVAMGLLALVPVVARRRRV